MNLYQDKSCYPKNNAQYNLEGRTHYVDDDTLRFHKSRILSTYITDGGLIFALVESYAVDMHNTQRAFRPVIFDIFGNVIERPKLEDGFKTSKKATEAMWDALNNIDAISITENGITQYQDQVNREIQYLREDMAKLQAKNVA